ncbi:hypothetical protein [Hymenobacter rubripertinctus]|uniref:YcxB family protein n=1 Tax=Hymenobacter rubripertinctus TaxID=2029981 RepID=A0A418QTB7_9BACT|nr:hypothetical protein [Hymenobacter rubripertinctus]RIY08392.1 hypothetical protein D0T11_14215 [Hymenobacter rubripertinctus]
MTIVIPQVRVDFRRYLALSLRYSFRRKPLMAVLLVPWLTFMWSAGALLTGPTSVIDVLKQNPLGMLFMLFFLLLPVLLVWGTWQQYQASSLLLNPADYVLNATGVSVRGPAMNTDLMWPAFTRADQFGSWLLLQASEQSAFFLDLQRIAPPATPADVLELVKSGGVSVH